MWVLALAADEFALLVLDQLNIGEGEQKQTRNQSESICEVVSQAGIWLTRRLGARSFQAALDLVQSGDRANLILITAGCAAGADCTNQLVSDENRDRAFHNEHVGSDSSE